MLMSERMRLERGLERGEEERRRWEEDHEPLVGEVEHEAGRVEQLEMRVREEGNLIIYTFNTKGFKPDQINVSRL